MTNLLVDPTCMRLSFHLLLTPCPNIPFPIASSPNFHCPITPCYITNSPVPHCPMHHYIPRCPMTFRKEKVQQMFYRTHVVYYEIRKVRFCAINFNFRILKQGSGIAEITRYLNCARIIAIPSCIRNNNERYF